MNKTVTITLNGVIFHIEEDAYLVLQEYLDNIKNYFKETDEVDEMISDIEMSIAEKFTKKINAKKKVITEKDVNNVMEIMGTVEDFVGEGLSNEELGEKKDYYENEENSPKSWKKNSKIKKLYRNPDDVILGGVCSGIAEYFGIDAVFVRLFFVAITFLGGTGIWVYLVLWIVMPMAKTNSQKLEMKGAPVTLKKLEEAVKKKVKNGTSEKQKEKINSFFENFFNFFKDFFNAILNFLKRFVPIIRILCGFFIFLSSIFAIAGFMFLAGVMLFKVNSPYINPDFPINEIVGGSIYYLWVSLAFVVIIIPFIFLLLLGIGIIKKKNLFNFLSFGSLFVIWLFSLISFGIIAIDAIPKIKYGLEDYQKKYQITQDYYVVGSPNFIIDGYFNVSIIEGDNWGISASGKDVDVKSLLVENNKDVIEISKKEIEKDFCFFCNSERLDIEIVTPSIEKIKAKNNVYIEMKNFSVDDLEIVLDNYSRMELIDEIDIFNNIVSSSTINKEKKLFVKLDNGSRFNGLELEFENTFFEIDDYSRMSIDGKSDNLKLIVNNNSNFEGFNFFVKNAEVKATDYSRVLIEVSDDLSLTGRDYSRFIYKGKPDIVKDLDKSSSLKDY